MKRFLVVANHAFKDVERATMPFAIANAIIKDGNEVVLFLASDAVELAREGVAEKIKAPNFPPLEDLLMNLLECEVKIISCIPCSKNRDVNQEDVLSGVSFGAGPELAREMALADSVISI